MKRKLLMLLVAVVAIVSLVIVGCAPEAAPPPEEEAPPPEEEEEAPPAAPEAEVFELAWQDISPPGSSMYIILERLADRVRAASGGRLDITVYPEGEIVPRHETSPGVKERVVDMATSASAMDLGRLGPIVHLMVEPGLPGGPSIDECVAWAYRGGGVETMNEVWKDWGYVLGIEPGSAELFCHSNKPLEKASDFKGIKFRTLGLWAEIVEEYGASVVMLPGGELYTSIERGVLDAFELGPPSYNWPHGFQEICDYIGIPGIQAPGFGCIILINKDSWNELPTDLQALLKDEILAMATDAILYHKLADAEAMDKYRDYGTKIFTVSDELQQDICAKSKAACEAFAAEDPQFREIWEQQLAIYSTWRGVAGIFPKYSIFD